MTISPYKAILALRWVLGLVLLVESARFALASAAAHGVANIALPPWLPLLLGGSEVLAALLFLLPSTRRAGGLALLAIFAIAILIHFLHGQFDVGNLFVYAMATIVCISRTGPTPGGGA